MYQYIQRKAKLTLQQSVNPDKLAHLIRNEVGWISIPYKDEMVNIHLLEYLVEISPKLIKDIMHSLHVNQFKGPLIVAINYFALYYGDHGCGSTSSRTINYSKDMLAGDLFMKVNPTVDKGYGSNKGFIKDNSKISNLDLLNKIRRKVYQIDHSISGSLTHGYSLFRDRSMILKSILNGVPDVLREEVSKYVPIGSINERAKKIGMIFPPWIKSEAQCYMYFFGNLRDYQMEMFVEKFFRKEKIPIPYDEKLVGMLEGSSEEWKSRDDLIIKAMELGEDDEICHKFGNRYYMNHNLHRKYHNVDSDSDTYSVYRRVSDEEDSSDSETTHSESRFEDVSSLVHRCVSDEEDSSESGSEDGLP